MNKAIIVTITLFIPLSIYSATLIPSGASGLGTMSVQNADNVNITGGSITGISIDGSITTANYASTANYSNETGLLNGFDDTDFLKVDNDLSDLTSSSDARNNLGLGDMSLQSSNNVTITGGTITGITISTANYALIASTANYATSAGSADSALTANYSTTSNYSLSSGMADYATESNYSNSSGQASTATTANYAVTANDSLLLNGFSDSAFAKTANNLSDMSSTADARVNLGLGDISLQTSNNVSISGGSLSGVTITGTISTANYATTANDALSLNGLADTSFLKSANNLSDISSSVNARVNLGLGDLAVQSSADVSVSTINALVVSANRLRFGDGTSMTTAPTPGDSGTVGAASTGNIAIYSASTTVTGNTNLYWDNANSRLGIGTTAPTSSLTIISGNVVFSGTYGSGDVIGWSGNSSRMMWYPKKAAFRAGVSSGEWDDANIGNYSSAFGNYPRAKGNYSFAGGNQCIADGDYSTVFGGGVGSAGSYNFGAGYNHSLAGSYTSGFGEHVTSKAGTSYSFASGYYLYLNANYETTFGRYNWSPTGQSGFVATDILFSLGNGSSASATSNAFVVLKSGRTGIAINNTTPNETLQVSGNIAISNTGGVFKIKSGENASIGTANMTAGVVTINNTLIAANDLVIPTPMGDNTNVGGLWVSNITGGTSFTITSTNASHAGTIYWLIIKQY
jgi:hypothetical protein